MKAQVPQKITVSVVMGMIQIAHHDEATKILKSLALAMN